ncbi:serine/threonine protein kinase [Streptomyces venezuelae]|uniref:serine/threonine protein kinase n=1 Tax=Streptomyces venezuelae TaxID=54571 RepID=UPI001CC2473F|nr:serine/threonine-protein kinase [Streptomyces venezuelae]
MRSAAGRAPVARRRSGEILIGTGIDDIFTPLGPDDPREVAGYRLVAKLGAGGMGTVYLSHTRGGQPVALKLILREYGQDPEFRRRFEQEVQAARRVQGYHLVPVVDHDTSGPSPWLASAFVPGVTLHEALGSLGPLPLSTVFPLIGCAARALTSIHAAGVVHRDLKPANIMLAPTGPYVIDFGIARAADATQITRSGRIIGTPQFMSPEHALGEPVTPATDVFSLGLIAAVASTGRHPYGEGGAFTVGTRIANTAMRPPDLDGYPTELRPLLDRCLTPEPADRITPAELADWCERVADRPSTALGDWLPAPVAAAVDRRVRAAAGPRPDTGDDPAAEPTMPPRATGPGATGATAGTGTAQVAADTTPPLRTAPTTPLPPHRPPTSTVTAPPPTGQSPAATAPTTHGQSPSSGPPSTGPGTPPPSAASGPPSSGYGPGSGPAPAYGPPPAAPDGGRPPAARRQTRIAVAVTVAVLLVAGTWRVAQSFGDGGGDDARNAGGSTPSADRTAGPSKDGTSPADQATTAPKTTPPPDDAGYTLVFKDRPFALRAPAEPGIAGADLDVPELRGTGDYMRSASEVVMSEVSGGRWEFPNGMGISSGKSARQCLEGSQGNVLPQDIDADQLQEEIPVGTLLCAKTNENRLTLLEITKITKNAGNDLPSYFTKLTVWKK